MGITEKSWTIKIRELINMRELFVYPFSNRNTRVKCYIRSKSCHFDPRYRLKSVRGGGPRPNSGVLPGIEPWLGHCVVFLDKTLYSHSASLHPGWVPVNCLVKPDEMLGGNLQWTLYAT